MTRPTKRNCKTPTKSTKRATKPKITRSTDNDGQRVELKWANRELLASIFGTDEPNAANHLLSGLMHVLHPDSSEPVKDITLVTARTMLEEGITPTDPLEGMLGVQIVGCYAAAMDMLARSMLPGLGPQGKELYANLAIKLMRTFAAQVEALNRGRGKTSIQRVVVERVDVREGGQAIVGAVSGGEGAEKG